LKPEKKRKRAVEEITMDNPNNRGQPDRSKINMHKDYEVKYWTKELGVSKEELQKAVDKVGNSAAAVRKELAA
jgi:3-oxoacyl-[acyl-carrier-protein] synthase III